mmetsp:Transcript_66437/g.107800  ORF Transcript_66437/g.107800 Transcript_66437/m.107800 type:complete len:80 (+) Transcript_66437:3297-3536(+)
MALQRLHWWVATGSSAHSSQVVRLTMLLKLAGANILPYLPAKAWQNRTRVVLGTAASRSRAWHVSLDCEQSHREFCFVL